ncbi:MAG: hypothetical protein Q9161_000613 [Pseudevernia consocians]
MILPWPLSPYQTLLSLTCLLIIPYYTIQSLTARASRRRRFLASQGCKPPRKWRNRDFFLGLDFLWASYRAIQEHRALEMSKVMFDRLGAHTVRMSVLAMTVVATVEPENLKWQHSREMLRPNFVRTQIGDVEMFEKHVEHLIQAIPRDGSTVHLQDLFLRFSLDVATDLLFGESTNTLAPEFADAEVTEFVEAWGYCLQALDGSGLSEGEEGGYIRLAKGFLRLFLPNAKSKQKIKVVNNFVDKLVENAMTNRNARKSESEKRRTSRYIFLDELVSQTSDKIKIRSELLNILLAGRDTTASLLSNVWFELSKRPDVWSRLHREIIDSLPDGGFPTFETLKDMKYLRAVLNESLRLYPVVPENSRQAEVDTVLPVGGGEDGKSPVFVAKGQLVHWSLYTMHRRKDLYGEDAESFVPERWLDQGDEKGLRVGWEYLPFNGGPRICIGPKEQFALTEASYVTVRLLQEFPRIESRDPEPWREKLALTCTCLGGCKVALFPRAKEDGK